MTLFEKIPHPGGSITPQRIILERSGLFQNTPLNEFLKDILVGIQKRIYFVEPNHSPSKNDLIWENPPPGWLNNSPTNHPREVMFVSKYFSKRVLERYLSWNPKANLFC